MNCPNCDGDTHVTDTKYNGNANERYRRHKCKGCGHIMWTIEFEVEFDDRYRKQWNDCNRMKRGIK